MFIDRWGPMEADMNVAREIGGANYIEGIAGFVLSGRAERESAMEEKQKASRDENAAREAMFRMQRGPAEAQTDFSVFGSHQKTSAVGTIFDLLIGILN